MTATSVPARAGGHRVGAPSGPRVPSGPRPLWREALVVVALFGLYNLGRWLGTGAVGGAYDNGRAILSLQHDLGMPSELSLQRWALGFPDLMRLFNSYYAVVHLPLTTAVVVWIFLQRRAYYPVLRRALVIGTFTGLVVQVSFPVAPPRMFPSLGFIDTGLAFGQSVYGPTRDSGIANQFAAMPSFHAGWAALVAVAMIGACRTRWRWLWLLHAAMTFVVVVATANHYWLDVVAGVALCLTPYALARRRSRSMRRPIPCSEEVIRTW